jgi:hypothetical protein
MVILVLFAGCADKPVKFSITIGGPFDNGTIHVKDGLTEAAQGETVTLIAVPAHYFCLTGITVKEETSNAAIQVSGAGNERTFTMPPQPVKVPAAVFDLEEGAYSITMMGQYYNGDLTSMAGSSYDGGYAKEGETVTLIIVPRTGYYLDSVKITGKSTGVPIPETSIEINNITNKLDFIMPAENVVINGYNDGPIFLPMP